MQYKYEEHYNFLSISISFLYFLTKSAEKREIGTRVAQVLTRGCNEVHVWLRFIHLHLEDKK